MKNNYLTLLFEGFFIFECFWYICVMENKKTEIKYSKSIERFIECQLVPFEVKFSKNYPDSLFWFKDGKAIVEIDKLKYFWVRRQIWNTISNMFSLDYGETQQVMKIWLEEQDKLGELTPMRDDSVFARKLEEQDKLGELTPLWYIQADVRALEEQNKLGELTPNSEFQLKVRRTRKKN